MDSKLEREIHFKKHDDQSRDDKWSLCEVNEAGVQVGADWEPWALGLTFSAVNVQLSEDLSTKSISALSFEEERIKFDPKLLQSSVISGELNLIEPEVMYPTNISFLGTGRSIESFSFHIRATKKGEDEYRIIRGIPSYEVGHGMEDFEDHIQIDIKVSEEQYGNLVRQITGKSFGGLELGISYVKGFYAQPFIHDEIKVLSGQKVIASNDSDAKPYQLKDIGELSIRVISTYNLAASESVRSSDIHNAFDDDTFRWDELDAGLFGVESQRATNALLAKLVSSQQELLKLKLPLWVGASALCLLLIKLWV